MHRADTRRFNPRRVALLVFAGVLLTQLAWILTLPTYRGIDEFDHVYKAEAVARGQWLSNTPAPNGRGGIVTINEKTIRDATAVCEFLPYTQHDNCHPAEVLGNGKATAASAAGAYNPAYYLVVGTVAKPFAGDTAVYVMRAVTALICAALLASAAGLIAQWARSAWPLMAYFAGLTPMLIYSTALASPNGIGYSGAALVWTSLLALDRYTRPRSVSAAGFLVGAGAVVSTHTTGPMWLFLIALSLLPLRGLRRWAQLFRGAGRSWGVALGITAIATLACLMWTLSANANDLGPTKPQLAEGVILAELVPQEILWLLQGIAAFPTRTEEAPAAVYVMWIGLLAMILVLAVRRAARPERMSLLLIVLLILMVQNVLTFISYAHQGYAWQGRYSLPLWLGLTGIAARSLGRLEHDPRKLWVLVFFGILATANAMSAVSVGAREVTSGPSDPLAAAFPGGFVLVGLLSVLGAAFVTASLARSPKGLVHVVRPAPSMA